MLPLRIHTERHKNGVCVGRRDSCSQREDRNILSDVYKIRFLSVDGNFFDLSRALQTVKFNGCLTLNARSPLNEPSAADTVTT